MIKVSVVLLNYNGKHHLEEYLPVLLKHTTDSFVEICVIDNASTDDSISFLQQNYPQVRIIRLSKNFGFSGGYNRGLQEIKATYYVLLNTDVEVTSDWLYPMVNYLDTHTDVQACQPKILSYRDRRYFEHAGAAGGFIDKYGYPFCRGRVFTDVEKDNGQYDSVIEVFWATGACLFIRADTFHHLGGFDDDFFAHMEEIDLCWRLKSRKGKVVCVPQSIVYHLGAGTLQVENPHKTYLNFRNNLFMLYKNLPTKNLLTVFFVRFFLDYLAAVKMFLTGEFPNGKAVFKARIDFWKMRQKMHPKRIENMSKMQKKNLEQVYRRSLVFSYFFCKKNNYDKLMK
jgi:GT2 family glycosyltransferase